MQREQQKTKNRKPKSWLFLASIALILATASMLALPLLRGESPLNLGLDLAGGVTVTYRPDFDKRLESYGDSSEQELLEIAKENLATRLYKTMSTVPEVVVRGDQRIEVSLPAVEDYRSVLDLVGQTYHLTLRLVEQTHGEPSEGVPLYSHQGRSLELSEVAFSGEMLDERSVRVESAAMTQDLMDPSAKIAFRFRPPHDDAFAEFTAAHVGEQMAILLNDEVEWVGVIESAIRGPGLLAGGYSAAEASDIAAMLRAGTLPVALEVEDLSAIGPSLGQELQERGFQALLLTVGLLLTLVAAAYLHRPALLLTGLASVLVLLIAITGLAAALGLTLDLVGIAGIVLSVGMGMDAFILVFEALERRLRGARGEVAAEHAPRIIGKIYSFAGEGHTLFHANASTLVVILLLFGTERLRSFALFIVVGILASVATLFVTRSLLGWLQSSVIGRMGGPSARFVPDLLGWLRRARPRLFRFRRVYGLTVAAILLATLAGLVFPFSGGPALELGPDFRPGTQLRVAGASEAVATASESLRESFPGLTVRQQSLGESSEGRFLLTLDAPLAPRSESALREPGGGLSTVPTERVLEIVEGEGVTVGELTSIDGKVSARRTFQSLAVLLLSFVFLGLYFVFLQDPLARLLSPRARMASQGSTRLHVLWGILLAVAVDLALVAAALAWLRIPLGLPVVAGVLTIVGYSVNDSVVLWSHVQRRHHEARGAGERTDPVSLVTGSVDAILVRACLTSLSTLVPAVTILTVGIEPLAGFAWLILVGTLAGTASSIFVVGAFAARALGREEVNRRRGRAARPATSPQRPATAPEDPPARQLPEPAAPH